MVIVLLVVLVVNVLLLFAAGRLAEGTTNGVRVLMGATLGALFACISMAPGFSFLGHILWQLCCLLLTGLLAYGFSWKGLGASLLFSLLHLSLGGLTGKQNEWLSFLLGAAGIGFACLLLGKRQYLVPVELTYRDQTLHLTALHDTGNTLRDPVTGNGVLIVGADVAHALTGLTQSALLDPVRTIENVPGLRLIPYKTVGNTGFLLALSVPQAKIGNKRRSTLVALSPNLFGSNYQALTGGMV